MFCTPDALWVPTVHPVCLTQPAAEDPVSAHAGLFRVGFVINRRDRVTAALTGQKCRVLQFLAVVSGTAGHACPPCAACKHVCRRNSRRRSTQWSALHLPICACIKNSDGIEGLAVCSPASCAGHSEAIGSLCVDICDDCTAGGSVARCDSIFGQN